MKPEKKRKGIRIRLTLHVIDVKKNLMILSELTAVWHSYRIIQTRYKIKPQEYERISPALQIMRWTIGGGRT